MAKEKKSIPFTTQQFFEVFTRYNEAVWPMQVLLNLLAFVVIALLFRRPGSANRLISAALSFLWAWMAIAYHFLFFTAINPAAWLFGAVFLAGAMGFAWLGLLKRGLRFRPASDPPRWAGALLIGFALAAYPLLGYLLGHRYPAVPTFGLPCPTTIFTIGILLFAEAPPKSVFIVPLLWSGVGTTAAFQLGVFQDLGLGAAGLVGLVAVIFRPASAESVRSISSLTRRNL
jgi:hypothetical protein